MPIRIQYDSREKPHAIQKILYYFDKNGIEAVRMKLDVGDYMTDPPGRVSVDRKQNLGEVVGNVCQQHERFKKECIRAKESGIQLIFLVEHGGQVKTLEDVREWQNPRLDYSPYAVSGKRLYQIMKTYEAKYGVRWEFCDKRSTGRRIVELLKEDEKD